MEINDDILEELLEVANTLWLWLPLEKQRQLPLFKKAVGRANFAFNEAKLKESNHAKSITKANETGTPETLALASRKS